MRGVKEVCKSSLPSSWDGVRRWATDDGGSNGVVLVTGSPYMDTASGKGFIIRHDY